MSSFPFLDLPYELQDRVLEFHFNKRFNLRITQHVIGSGNHAEIGHRRVYAAGNSKHLSILSVCSQLYPQALRALHNSFTGYLDLSSVQYSSKYSMSRMSIPIPDSLPRHLLTSIDLGKIEWREALLVPSIEGLENLKLVRFASSTKGKRAQSFLDIYDMSPHDDVTQPFYNGNFDDYFLAVVEARARRVWRGDSPELPSGVRWDLELIGESCPSVNDCYLTTYCTFTCVEDLTLTRRAIVHPKRFLRACETCVPGCVYFTGRVKYCHECTAPNSLIPRNVLTHTFLEGEEAIMNT